MIAMNPHVQARKGQSAIEYLTTYGWALLAILVVGAFLVQFGIFDQCQASEPDFGPGDVSVTSSAFTGEQDVAFTLQAFDDTINVTDVALTDLDHEVEIEGGEEISSGTEETIEIDGIGSESGECVNSHLSITYDIEDGIEGATATTDRPFQDRAP